MDFEKVNIEMPRQFKNITYALGWRESEYVTNFLENDPVYWEKFLTSNDKYITKVDGDTADITLQGGKTYKIIGKVGLRDATDASIYRRFQWYNVTIGESIGSQGGFYTAATGDCGIGCSDAIAYVTVPENEEYVFQLRCVYQSGDVDVFTYGTSFEVANIQNQAV